MIVLLIVFAVTVGLYLLKSKYNYWSKRGVIGPTPKYFVGNLGASFVLKKSPAEIFGNIYNDYKNTSVVGIYKASTPSLLICDPEAIKNVTIKSFQHFRDNDIHVDKKTDPLLGRNPFVLNGDEWKTVRTQLTPGFTSGKMKWLYPLLEDISKDLIKFIESEDNTTNGEGYEAKELCKRFTLNNVASCAFGIEAKCFVEENSEFKQIADRFLTPEGWMNSILIFLSTIFPFLLKITSIKFIPKDVEEKLTNIVSQTLKYRQENNIVRNDYLHIISELKKTCKEYDFTDVDIAGHASTFFVDGYETSSIVMSFVLYELARNPEAQDKLREEVNHIFAANNNKLPYDVLQEMTYLDAVLNETLRKHPPLAALQKLCTKSFPYEPVNKNDVTKPFTIEKGTPIIIPLLGLHYDVKYFEDPQSFKPERFIGANKDKLTKYSFMPFGEGPRICLGRKFGILQIKIGVAYIINNYKVFVNKKTKEPIKYHPLYFLTLPVGGLWLDFKKIT